MKIIVRVKLYNCTMACWLYPIMVKSLTWLPGRANAPAEGHYTAYAERIFAVT
jgi:hypothetical protein